MKAVSGGVGTIKRKREIRELLEEQDVGYEDDIFDSTPFKRWKDVKVPNALDDFFCLLPTVENLVTLFSNSSFIPESE